jgi:polar amino acid transport system substrate-binding protein
MAKPTKKIRQRRRLDHAAPLLMLCLLTMVLAVVAGPKVYIESHDQSLDRARSTEGLRIGYAVEAPYAFLRADGRVSGVEPAVALEVARRLGITSVQWRLVRFGTLVDGLLAGDYDMVAAGLFVTEERARHVAFSHPTLRVTSALLTSPGNPERLYSYEVFAQRPSLRIAVLGNSVEARALLAIVADSSRVVVVPDAATGAEMVRTGAVHALALSTPTVRWYAAQHPEDFNWAAMDSSAGTRKGVDETAFAFRPEDRALREAWDVELARFVGSPEHRQLLERFGVGVNDASSRASRAGMSP